MNDESWRSREWFELVRESGEAETFGRAGGAVGRPATTRRRRFPFFDAKAKRRPRREVVRPGGPPHFPF